MTAVVEVDHLQKRYGNFVAVEDVSFAVEEGEIFGILGPNGSGKTTTVECLQGLRKADAGGLRVLGHDPLRESKHLRARIGSQLQESALPERIKVWEALAFFSSMVPDGSDWETVMEEWGLADKRSATFASLSGGQQQRLFVALAVVNRPELVFLDEMTTGLDPSSRRVAWDLIRQVRDGGATVVLVTHFMDEAENLCDRLAVIDRKRVVAVNTPDGLVETHAGKAEVTFSTDTSDLGFLHRVEGVDSVHRDGRRVSVRGDGALLVRVASELAAHGLEPTDLQVRRASLEDVFLTMTSKEL
ncbi:MAG: ABC transporter ATP-binding protein [Acidimicrobiia bacterium]|nr:ABC transporter ATP-binding protein [Acidimicrobiia bacterium]